MSIQYTFHSAPSSISINTALHRFLLCVLLFVHGIQARVLQNSLLRNLLHLMFPLLLSLGRRFYLNFMSFATWMGSNGAVERKHTLAEQPFANIPNSVYKHEPARGFDLVLKGHYTNEHNRQYFRGKSSAQPFSLHIYTIYFDLFPPNIRCTFTAKFVFFGCANGNFQLKINKNILRF